MGGWAARGGLYIPVGLFGADKPKRRLTNKDDTITSYIKYTED